MLCFALNAGTGDIVKLFESREATMKAILLVTWIIAGEPPSSYQTQFSSMESCQAARQAVLQDGVRINSEQNQYAARVRATGMRFDPPPKQVTAVCAAQ